MKINLFEYSIFLHGRTLPPVGNIFIFLVL